MNMGHEDDLWQITVDVKQYNPNLLVYVAVGGWTFSDNGTVTQPLFGEIARTETNRQKFADNVVKFLNKYGFDGLDIDWEYPGAGDRGGHDEDTPNFVLLMKTLRTTFDASPRHLGLTFTIPSSFWYLRWFDMPGLLQYADWTNLMSYDLHGTW
jgi:chitinase